MDVLDELERRLTAAIEAEQRRAPRRRRRPRRRGLPLATGGALAALATIALVVVVVTIAAGGGDGGDEKRLPSSPVLLERAAEAAEQAPPPPVLRDGELWYVRGERVDLWAIRGPYLSDLGGWAPYPVDRRATIEQWSGLGGEGRIRRLTISARPRLARDRRKWATEPRSQRPFPPDRDVVYSDVRGLPLASGLFTPQQLRDLPSEPAALLRAIEAAVQRRSESGPLGPNALATAQYEAIRDLLLLPVSPQQRAGLLRSFALLPRTRVARIDTDTHGRRGVVLVFHPRTSPPVPRVLVVSDTDGRLLAERGPRKHPETTFVAQGVATGVDALPRGIAEPEPEPRSRLPRTTTTAQPPPPPVPGEP